VQSDDSRFKGDEVAMRFLHDAEAQKGYKNTKVLSSIRSEDYDTIFYVGGHGPGSPFAEFELIENSHRFAGRSCLHSFV
jgi:hypothetical protein